MSESAPSDFETPDEEEEEISLEDLIRGFLQENEFLHEFRLQKLLYLADIITRTISEDRLSDADFKPYMYGSYSEDLRDTLEELQNDLPHRPDRQYGKVTTAYLGGRHPSVSSDELWRDSQLEGEEKEIIETVVDATENWSSADLGDWSKESWLYKNTPYGEEMNFDRIEQNDERVKEELISTFPALQSLLEKNIDE